MHPESQAASTSEPIGYWALLRDNPQSAGIQRLLGRAYLENGQPELAQQAMEAAQSCETFWPAYVGPQHANGAEEP